jgi:AraC-like DNA-binding protein
MQNIDSNNIISFIARHAVVDIHYHKCFQIVISLGAPFNSIIDGKSYSSVQGFLINQDITHSCKAEETDVLVYFIDSGSYQGWQLKEILDGKPFVMIDAVLPLPELHEVIRQYSRATSLKELQKTAGDLIEKIVPLQREPGKRIIDDRIVKAFEYIDLHFDNPMVLEDISGQVFLSAERLRHLFAQETGIPFSQYILWKRIKLVLTQVIKDEHSMADAAIQNGFTD